MQKINEGVLSIIQHKNRLRSLQLKINSYHSNISKPKPQPSLSLEFSYDRIRKARLKRIKQQNKRMVSRIIDSTPRTQASQNSDYDHNRKSITFYVNKNLIKQKLLYKQNLQIIHRISHSKSEIERLNQCWMSLGAQNYGKIHTKYRKEKGKVILKKLELFQKAQNCKLQSKNNSPKSPRPKLIQHSPPNRRNDKHLLYLPSTNTVTPRMPLQTTRQAPKGTTCFLTQL